MSSHRWALIAFEVPGNIYLSFLVKSWMGFNSFWSSRQNILTKFTIPTKLLQPLMVVGGFNFWIASSLLLNGFTHYLLSFIYMVFPIYRNSVLKNWHFFGDIFSPFLHNVFNKSSNLAKWVVFDGVNNSKSSMIASQYFLQCKQSKIAFM